MIGNYQQKPTCHSKARLSFGVDLQLKHALLLKIIIIFITRGTLHSSKIEIAANS
jgi:hypothetical protein